LIHGNKACTSLESRLERLSKAKHHADLGARHIFATHPEERDLAQRQIDCSTWLIFRAPVGSEDFRLTQANFCQLTHTCEPCAIARAGRLMGSALNSSLALIDDQPQLEAHFVTLTTRNGQKLGETYQRLDRGLKGMMLRRRQRGRNAVLRNLVGGFGQVETKRGKSGGWHPHYHGLWFFHGRPDYRALQETWSSAVGESAGARFQLIDAEKARIAGQIERKSLEYREKLISGLCEIIKYTCKFSIGQVEDQWHASAYYRGRRARLFRRFGDLVGVDEPTDLADELPDWDFVDLCERVFRFNHSTRRYVETQERRQGLPYSPASKVQG
jgi:hypothetical protein